MHRCVSIIVVPLLAICSDQASNAYYSANLDAAAYTEHLDSIREGRGVEKMIKYLSLLDYHVALQVSIILYISPSTFTSIRWRGVIGGLISGKLVRFFCIDECHYITSAGRHF